MEQRAEILRRLMEERNMKVYPIYKMLSWDLLFYYSINFIFLKM